MPSWRTLPSGSIPLVYIDPPFNTGSIQKRRRVRAVRDDDTGQARFGARLYRTEAALNAGADIVYDDRFDDFLSFLRPRLEEAHRILTPHGSLFLHIDPREVHYCKVMLDGIFTRRCFQNEIIWAYDYGARPSRRWPTKHDNLLWYTRHPTHYTFDLSASDRIPYMAPRMVGAAKAARGKTPTDVWWHTIVSHHRQGEDRLSHPEAARHPGAHHPRSFGTWRHRP